MRKNRNNNEISDGLMYCLLFID